MHAVVSNNVHLQEKHTRTTLLTTHNWVMYKHNDLSRYRPASDCGLLSVNCDLRLYKITAPLGSYQFHFCEDRLKAAN